MKPAGAGGGEQQQRGQAASSGGKGVSHGAGEAARRAMHLNVSNCLTAAEDMELRDRTTKSASSFPVSKSAVVWQETWVTHP